MNDRDASRALRKLLPDQPRKMLPCVVIHKAVARDVNLQEGDRRWNSPTAERFHQRLQAFERVLQANGWYYDIRHDAFLYRPGGRG